MKLNTVTAVASKGNFGSNGQNENKAERLPRMVAYWQDPANAILIPCGKFLSTRVQDATGMACTIADVLVTGEDIELDGIKIEGVTLPLVAGFKLSLSNVSQEWGCPACRSAHGSGVYPSRDVRADLLQDCKFFYNPTTQAFFTISASCWQTYVVDLGANIPGRFLGAKTWNVSHRPDVTTNKSDPQSTKAA